MRIVVALVAGACISLVVACAAKRSSMAPASPTAETSGSAPTPAGPQDPHSQIEALTATIADQRVKLGLPAAVLEPPACPSGRCSPAPEMMTAHTDPACHPGSSDTCSSSCTLADSICDNATKICTLADQLPGDTWAADHCSSANTSCAEAHKRCCACQ
jgi:hypothetical protein